MVQVLQVFEDAYVYRGVIKFPVGRLTGHKVSHPLFSVETVISHPFFYMVQVLQVFEDAYVYRGVIKFPVGRLTGHKVIEEELQRFCALNLWLLADDG